MNRRVLTIGTFDLFHEGHRQLLWRASGFGDLYVGVNSDRFVEHYKGRFPVCREMERFQNVADHEAVERVFFNDGPGRDLIRRIKPELLVIGSDWHGSAGGDEKYLEQLCVSHREMFEEIGCGIVYLPRTPDVSTSELRA